ncbi:MAG: helix-turn-helix transcriptional regulator [Lachnospiraceae bacterium]|nr:helix-turn-helix transcriptional regulator [Lachnospiraceae bacterium]
MANITEEIGKRIKYYRKERKLTVKQLAEALGKKQGTVYKYESGEISIDAETLLDIANILKITPEQLFTITEITKKREREMDLGENITPKLYVYHYDGRHNRIIRSLIRITEDELTESFLVVLHYDLKGETEYLVSEYLYKGRMILFDHIVYFQVQNVINPAEFITIETFHPWHSSPYAWGMLLGILDAPITPAACKILVSVYPLENEKMLETLLRLNPLELEQIKNENLFHLLF